MFYSEDIYPTTRQEREQEAELRRVAEIRRVDGLHQEARNRALREVHARLGHIEYKLKHQNYGLVREDVEELRRVLDDEHGTPIIVERYLDGLFS